VRSRWLPSSAWSLPATVATLAVVAQPAAAAQFDISTVAGTGTAAYNGDGQPASSTRLNSPNGVTSDPEGNLLIADRDNQRIRVLEVSDTNPGYPCGGCVWTIGNVDTIAGTGTPAYNGDGIVATTATLRAPADVAVDSAGNVLIADQGNHRIRVIEVSVTNPGYPCSSCTWTPGHIDTIAGTGASGYTGDAIVADTAQLGAPGNVALDSTGNVLISDTGNGRIRVVAIAASNPGYTLGGHNCPCSWMQQKIYTIAGSDTTGFAGDGGPATTIGVGTSAELSNPHGVTTDAAGNVLIAAGSNNRVRIVENSATNPGYPCGGCTWTPGNIDTMVGNGGGLQRRRNRRDGGRSLRPERRPGRPLGQCPHRRPVGFAHSCRCGFRNEPGVSVQRLHLDPEPYRDHRRNLRVGLQRRRHRGHQRAARPSGRSCIFRRQPDHRRPRQSPRAIGRAPPGHDLHCARDRSRSGGLRHRVPGEQQCLTHGDGRVERAGRILPVVSNRRRSSAVRADDQLSGTQREPLLADRADRNVRTVDADRIGSGKHQRERGAAPRVERHRGLVR